MNEGLVSIEVDGRTTWVPRGQNLLVVLLEDGPRVLRRSVGGGARSALCAMGVCHECRVTVDGRPGVRACMVRCEPGLKVCTDA